MDIIEAMAERHSVRNFTTRELELDKIERLQEEIRRCNEESGLSIQLVTGESTAFSGLRAHYGKFNNVSNYIAIIGKKSKSLQETAGYYGERIMLYATMEGLQGCWVAGTFNKGKCKKLVGSDEKLLCVIALGYGETMGTPHKNKDMKDLYQAEEHLPDWFLLGMKGAMTAPTAMNQQKFHFSLKGDVVQAKATGGFFSDLDLGIVKYHFEQAAGKEHFFWAE